MGALAAGLRPIWSIENDAAIAEVAHANLGHDITVADILDCDPTNLDAPDVLHASPPCSNASLANANGGETELDMRLACGVAAFVTALRPRAFTLENVWAYRNFRSWRMIEEALHRGGYWVSVEHVNSADMGVPQTRKRMIVRAVRGGFVPYLPAPVPWVGWYAAIEDLIDTLPESQFAAWQLARLPQQLASFMMQVQGEGGDGIRFDHEPMQTVAANHGAAKYRAFLMGDQERQLAMEGEPAFTVRAGAGGGGLPRAFLVDSKNVNQERGKLHHTATEPAFTVVTDGKPSHMPRAWLVDGANTTEDQLSLRLDSEPSLTVTSGGPKHPLRSLLNTGRVVAMTPRALARFQSFPDWYQLSGNNRLDAKGVGNAVPPLLYQRIIESLMDGLL